MKYITGYNRNQLVLFPITFDETIDKNNEVHIINLFVESLDIATHRAKTGRFKPFKIFENIFLSYKRQSLKTPYI